MRVIRPVGLVELDRELALLDPERARHRTRPRAHLGDLQVGSAVQLDLAQEGVQRADRVRDHAADFVIRGINGQLGLDMLDVEESDPFGLPGSSSLGERRVLVRRSRPRHSGHGRTGSLHSPPRPTKLRYFESAWTWYFPIEFCEPIDARRSLFYSRS